MMRLICLAENDFHECKTRDMSSAPSATTTAMNMVGHDHMLAKLVAVTVEVAQHAFHAALGCAVVQNCNRHSWRQANGGKRSGNRFQNSATCSGE